MGKAEIISHYGNGRYLIKRVYGGRDEIQARIDALTDKITAWTTQYNEMPESSIEEKIEKQIFYLGIESLKKAKLYLQNNFPDDETVSAWCADFSTDLTGEVGTIDIPGEHNENVNIFPNGFESAAYDRSKHGIFYPPISMGPWTNFRNEMIYPGWQKFRPLHRYGRILDGTLDHSNNKCDVLLDVTKSRYQELDVNINNLGSRQYIYDITFEYMSCNSYAFEENDEVIIDLSEVVAEKVEKDKIDWSKAKIIGFKDNPAACIIDLYNMFGGEPESITAYAYNVDNNGWRIEHGEMHPSGYYEPDYSGLGYLYYPASYNWRPLIPQLPDDSVTIDPGNGELRFPIIIRCQPMVNRDGAKIYSFGGWVCTSDYAPTTRVASYVIDYCEIFNAADKTWSLRNKDQYIGRSYGAAWLINKKHYIACGAQYDDRYDTFFPHIDLNVDYEYAPGECPGTPGGPGAEQEIHRYYWGEIAPYIGAWSKYWDQELQTFRAVGEHNQLCTPTLGREGTNPRWPYPPPEGDRPYYRLTYDNPPYDPVNGYIGLYFWVSGSATWGKVWYEQPLFGEVLEFDDLTNSYASKEETTPVMMPGQFNLNNKGYICGGTRDQIAKLINSADDSGMAKNVLLYDPETNSWQGRKKLPYAMLNPSGVEIDGKGYIFSGYCRDNLTGSTPQDFGHEDICLNVRNLHPEGPAYRGGGSGVANWPIWLPEKTLPGESVTLYCTNNLYEYDPEANAWTEKQRAETPTGNCRYREWYNYAGSIVDPSFYGFKRTTVRYQRDDGTYGEFPCWQLAKFEAMEGPLNDYFELWEPGPYVAEYWTQTYGGSWKGVWMQVYDRIVRPRKRQWILKYPASSASGEGYFTSGGHVSTGDPIDHVYNKKTPWTAEPEPGRASIHIRVEQHMSKYNPITDSWSVREHGIKEHLSGGMTGL